jgi:hypothetical protein
LAKWFQKKRFKCEKLMGNGCQVMAKAHMAFPPGELTINCVGKIGQKSEGYFD